MEIKQLTIADLWILPQLFVYNDVPGMLAACTKDIQQGRIAIFVLYRENAPIGELRVKYRSEEPEFTHPGRRAYLYAFRILPEHQGKGYGKYLLQQVLNLLQKQGYSEFTVGVEDDNLLALHIYQSFGFREVLLRKQEEYQGDCYTYNLYLKRL